MTDGRPPDADADAAAPSEVFGRGAVDPLPGRVITFSGYTTLSTGPDGAMDATDGVGLYDFDTRILSRYCFRLDGERPLLVSGGHLDPARWVASLRLPLAGGSPEGPRLPRDTIELAIHRRVGHGLLDELEVANHGMVPALIQLAIDLDADFEESIAREGDRRDVGGVETEWDGGASTYHLRFDAEWRGHRVERAARVRLVDAPGPIDRSGGSLTFSIELPAKGRRSFAVVVESLVDGAWRSPLDLAPTVLGETERDRAFAAWRADRPHLKPAGTVLTDAFETAADDLFSLRAWDLEGARTDTEGDRDAWTVAAGVPLYAGIFGRDILTTGLQAVMIGAAPMRGALALVAHTQATAHDPFRDAEPGKMIHEMRRGPLSDLGVIPQRAYYGSQTTPSMFVLALSELWHWTGDLDAVRGHREAALRALTWATERGDLDGDGFLEYVRRAEVGPKNQGW